LKTDSANPHAAVELETSRPFDPPPSLSRAGLVRKWIEPFGLTWFPRGGEVQMRSLGSEVAEYFHPMVELAPDDVVVDVGANIGAFALEVARRSPSARLVCIEPIPVLYEALRRNMEERQLLPERGRLYQVGLTRTGGPEEAKFLFFKRLPCDSTCHIDEKWGQFERFFQVHGEKVRASSTRWVGAPVAGFLARSVSRLPTGPVGRWVFDRVTGATEVQCRLVTLDSLLAAAEVDRVGLLKIDVEGAELDVLEGVGPERMKRIRQIVLEGHDEGGRLDAIRKLVTDSGFDDVVVDKPKLSEERGLDNFLLFARRTRP
jgi:hypothetical protein